VENFLRLKGKGQHINTSLLSSTSFANPHIYAKLVSLPWTLAVLSILSAVPLRHHVQPTARAPSLFQIWSEILTCSLLHAPPLSCFISRRVLILIHR
jgi:hypothetical protein